MNIVGLFDKYLVQIERLISLKHVANEVINIELVLISLLIGSDSLYGGVAVEGSQVTKLFAMCKITAPAPEREEGGASTCCCRVIEIVVHVLIFFRLQRVWGHPEKGLVWVWIIEQLADELLLANDFLRVLFREHLSVMFLRCIFPPLPKRKQIRALLLTYV